MIKRRTDFAEGARIVGEIFGAAAPEQRTAAPRTINVDTVQAIHRPYVFRYRWRTYRIARVPAIEGCVLEYAHDRLHLLLKATATREALEEMLALVTDTQDLLWRMTRQRWWQRRNPFATCTLSELFAIMLFYSECRMRLPDLALVDTQGSKRANARRLRTILPTAWRNSPEHIRAG